MNITVLAGGVGGARFLRGLPAVATRQLVDRIVNVGDDLEVLGLHVSPDLDSVLYALAGLADERARLGPRRRDLARSRAAAGFGGDAWFKLGDRDLGLHLVRTEPLRTGCRSRR